MTSWARKIANLDLIRKSRVVAAAASGSVRNGSKSLAEKYSGDDSIAIFASSSSRTSEESRSRWALPDREVSGGDSDVDEAIGIEDGDEDDVEDAVYDQSDNLARACREFYERRLTRAAEERMRSPDNKTRMAAADKDKSLSTASACSSGYFSLNTSLSIVEGVTTTSSSVDDDDLILDVGSLQPKLDYLKRELLGLMDQDNDLFKQLLMLNDTIEELKESRTADRTILEEDEDEEDEEQQPLSFDPSDASYSSPLKKSLPRIIPHQTVPMPKETCQPPASFNFSLPVSRFQQSQQPPHMASDSISFDEADESECGEDDEDEADLINELLDEALNLTSDDDDEEDVDGDNVESPKSARNAIHKSYLFRRINQLTNYENCQFSKN
jgi:hypothetical protein